MPAPVEFSNVLDRHLLLQLGDRLKRARIQQRLTTTEMSRRAGLSRMTLSAIESGEPTPTMGSYLRVLSALGFSGDLALLATEALQHTEPSEPKRPTSTELVVTARDARHELQDLQSLMLHEEAVRLMQKNPELVEQALETLERWRSAGNSHSRFLWDEWSVILRRRQWRRALAHTRRSKELRQASPVPTVLPPEIRQRILDEVQQLKAGVSLGSLPLPPTPVRAPRSR